MKSSCLKKCNVWQQKQSGKIYYKVFYSEMWIKDRNFCKPGLSQKLNKEQLQKVINPQFCEYEMPTGRINEMQSISFINQLTYLICKLLPLENIHMY